MGLDWTNPVFGVSHKVRFKPVSSATETSKNIEILHVLRLASMISRLRITKVLISLCECAGWSVLLLLVNPEDKGFFGIEAHIDSCCAICLNHQIHWLVVTMML